jgi:hypothetical protein
MDSSSSPPTTSSISPASAIRPVFVLICFAAILVRNRRFHIAFVAATLVYQVSFILRLFDTIV